MKKIFKELEKQIKTAQKLSSKRKIALLVELLTLSITGFILLIVLSVCFIPYFAIFIIENVTKTLKKLNREEKKRTKDVVDNS